jgi:hypothetical protein
MPKLGGWKRRLLNFADAAREFEFAWENPAFTRFELPAVEINHVIQQRYSAEPNILVTRSMVWDMELKKSWDPVTYIPYVVSKGRSWGRCRLSDNSEYFARWSIQQGWINDARGQVLENVYLDHASQRIVFLGATELMFENEVLMADDFQPTFYVEHATSGSEEAPLNLWRIVFLTDQPIPQLLEPLEAFVAEGNLPGFLEIYIQRDLGVRLEKTPRSHLQ